MALAPGAHYTKSVLARHPIPFKALSSVAINRRIRTRVIERTQGDRNTRADIRIATKIAHQLIHPVLASGRTAGEPGAISWLADPLERTWRVGGEVEAVVGALEEDLVPFAQVDKVDEDGAGGGGVVVVGVG